MMARGKRGAARLRLPFVASIAAASALAAVEVTGCDGGTNAVPAPASSARTDGGPVTPLGDASTDARTCSPSPGGDASPAPGEAIIASGQEELFGIAVDGTYVYWATRTYAPTIIDDAAAASFGGAIRRCAKYRTCSDPTRIAQSQEDPNQNGAVGAAGMAGRIGVAGGAVYWDFLGPLMKWDVSGCGGDPAPVDEKALTGVRGFNFVLSAGRVYASGTDRELVACSTGGCGGNPTVIASANGDSFGGIATDDANVFFTKRRYAIYENDTLPGSVLKCSASGCAAGADAAMVTANDPIAIAVDATNVYWTDNNGSVMTCAKTGCGGAPVTIAPAVAPGMVAAAAIVVDGTSVYWVSTVGLMKCPKTGCVGPPTKLGSAGTSLAVDDTSVYWTSGSDVKRLTPK